MRSQALIPEAEPTATVAVAMHCMHIATRGYRTSTGKLRRFGLRSEITFSLTW